MDIPGLSPTNPFEAMFKLPESGIRSGLDFLKAGAQYAGAFASGFGNLVDGISGRYLTP